MSNRSYVDRRYGPKETTSHLLGEGTAKKAKLIGNDDIGVATPSGVAISSEIRRKEQETSAKGGDELVTPVMPTLDAAEYSISGVS